MFCFVIKRKLKLINYIDASMRSHTYISVNQLYFLKGERIKHNEHRRRTADKPFYKGCINNGFLELVVVRYRDGCHINKLGYLA